jgi:ectoine hydroxylase-related dioxygenase (phytanoyl-CoA dioxygenase family)
MPKFVDIVEDVTSLSLSEMEEIKRIIEKVLIEKRRDEILQSGEEAKKELKEGRLKFSDSANDLMNMLNEPD